MITESKVTEIFCIADDFCKEFEVEITALSFKKVLCFRKACYFIAGEVRMGKGDFRIHFSDFQ